MQQLSKANDTDLQIPDRSLHDPLLLVWQNPDTRRFVEVGCLTDLGAGKYGFEYMPGARSDGFFPLSEFPDLERSYVCMQIPAFFANRVMSSRRESYSTYLTWLGIQDVPTPMEILARTGGGRATDTFHVVHSFQKRDGRCQGSFFASGISHISEVEKRLLRLRVGDLLKLRDDTANPVNTRAILLDAREKEEVGWVPDWLVEDIHALRGSSSELAITVEQVNIDAPDHLRLLCHLEATNVR